MPVTTERSITSVARRSQIVKAAIEVIAEVGYPRTSFARIAEHAGLSSTRLISYHFADKHDLNQAIVEDVMTAIGTAVGNRVGAEQSASGMLRAYIEGVVEFVAANRSRMKALMELLLNGAMAYGPSEDAEVVSHVEEILRLGQQRGEFRAFDPRIIGDTVQRSLDGLPFLLDSVPDLDPKAYARELVTLFELGTQLRPSDE
jgi:AcrR family transcriptional regulator